MEGKNATKNATKDFGAVRAYVHRVALVIHVTSGELQPICISSLIQNRQQLCTGLTVLHPGTTISRSK